MSLRTIAELVKNAVLLRGCGKHRQGWEFFPLIGQCYQRC